jgi:hypothetical protein
MNIEAGMENRTDQNIPRRTTRSTTQGSTYKHEELDATRKTKQKILDEDIGRTRRVLVRYPNDQHPYYLDHDGDVIMSDREECGYCRF